MPGFSRQVQYPSCWVWALFSCFSAVHAFFPLFALLFTAFLLLGFFSFGKAEEKGHTGQHAYRHSSALPFPSSFSAQRFPKSKNRKKKKETKKGKKKPF